MAWVEPTPTCSPRLKGRMTRHVLVRLGCVQGEEFEDAVGYVRNGLPLFPLSA
jgi:hypothetical protein